MIQQYSPISQSHTRLISSAPVHSILQFPCHKNEFPKVRLNCPTPVDVNNCVQCLTNWTCSGYIDTIGDSTSKAVFASQYSFLRQAAFHVPTIAISYERGRRNQLKRASFRALKRRVWLPWPTLCQCKPLKPLRPSPLLDMSFTIDILTRKLQTIIQADHAGKDAWLIDADI